MLHAHLSSGAGIIGQLVADVPSELSLTPPHENKKILRANRLIEVRVEVLKTTIFLSETAVTSSSFCSALGKQHGWFRGLILDKGMLKMHLHCFLEEYALSKHRWTEKKT
jgi:hypothetical protein